MLCGPTPDRPSIVFAHLFCIPESVVKGVGTKYSCGPLVELEQSTEPPVTLDATGVWRWRNRGREEQVIAFTLVRAFEMVMLDKLSDCTAQRRFAEEDQLGETLTFDGAYPAFREGI